MLNFSVFVVLSCFSFIYKLLLQLDEIFLCFFQSFFRKQLQVFVARVLVRIDVLFKLHLHLSGLHQLFLRFYVLACAFERFGFAIQSLHLSL
ncbi:MAG: hypothetical protein CMM02_14205 [Rhodopirellula sp.]|nr:hypothetical protein [Rhodopirellula sp.]